MTRPCVLWCVLPLAAGCAGPDLGDGYRPAPGFPLAVEEHSRPEVPDTPITIEQALPLALAASASLVPHRAALRVARAEQAAAYEVRDPQVRFAYGESDRTEEGDLGREEEKRRRHRGVLRIYPPNPWAQNAVANGGEARMELAAANLRAAEHDVVARVHLLFHEARCRRAERGTLQRVADVRRDQLEQIEERLSRGVGTAPAALTARLDALDVTVDWERARREELRAITDLATCLGFEDGGELEIADPPVPSVTGAPMNRDLDAWVEQAFDRRSDLAAMEWRAEMARWDLTAARRAAVPWFDHIQGAYTEERNGVDEDTWSVQAAIELPVFSRGGSDVGIAKASEDQFRAEAARARAQVRGEVRQSLGRLRLARGAAERFEQETAPALDELNAGLASEVGNALRPQDRADVLEGILKAERLRLEAALAYERAWIELQIAAGSDWLVRPSGSR